MPRAWYGYNGGIPANVAAAWDLLDPQEPDCVGTANLCAISVGFTGIVAPAPHPNPPLSANLRSYIALAAVISVNGIPIPGPAYVLKKS